MWIWFRGYMHWSVCINIAGLPGQAVDSNRADWDREFAIANRRGHLARIDTGSLPQITAAGSDRGPDKQRVSGCEG
jgi:hypothetical protein